MLSTEQSEPAAELPRLPDSTQVMLGSPDLRLRATFFPFGFPAEVRTNSEAVLEQFRSLWGRFTQERNAPPILCEVELVESSSRECPPAPSYRLMPPLIVCTGDADNYCIVDLERQQARMAISSAALHYPSYVQFFFLGLPVCCIATEHATPVHAGCVSLGGRGILLCGDSGAGKSTVSYACARAGWTYTSDDASYLVNGGEARVVTGNCHQLRFRPSARQLFAELEGLEITPRAVGKPSIEVPTARLRHITVAPTAEVDFIVYLNQHAGGPSRLVPYSREQARRSMQQVLYGPPRSLERQYAAIDKLLTAEIFEMRSPDLDWVVDRLQTLAENGA